MFNKPGKLVFKTCLVQTATVGIGNVSDTTIDVDVVLLESKNFSNSVLDQIL